MAFDGSVRIQVAGEIAVQLAKIFSRAKISFAVTGFSGYGGDVRVRASGANALNENLTIENINWIPFKTWGESMQRAAAKLGSIAQWTGYSTPDYSALSVAIEDIAKRPESRKILFVLTDADAYTAEHIRHIDKMAVSQGITLVAVGIQSREVTEIFQNAANVENVSELASTSFTKLLHTLKG
jgi:cobalamin biosynthesis protein CobT